MQVDLTPAQESIVAEAIRSGRYHDANEVIEDALHVLKVERLAPKAAGNERQQAIERLRCFGKQHELSLGSNVTVKDLINEGRR